MSSVQPNRSQNPYADLFKIWTASPFTASWVVWQRYMWMSNPLSKLFPVDAEEMWTAFVNMGQDLAARPELLEERTTDLLRAYTDFAVSALQQGPVKNGNGADKKDNRFADEAWTNNLVFSTLKDSYLIMSDWLIKTADAANGLDPQTHHRVKFYVRQFVDSMSPSNFLLTNPAALRETLNTGGENLRRGMENLIEDLKRGDVSNAGRDHFKVGKNLALTPGKVVFRNRLIELVQYTPKTDQVHKIPLLIMPPWINKFYILDMRPGRSFVEYMVQQGFTVFMVSWKNPDASMQDMVMQDYIQLGPLEAMKAVKAITGSAKVNMLGYCIGGTLLAITLAYLSAIGDDSVCSSTYFTALQDFTDVGDAGVFISDESLAQIERWVHPKGYVDGIEMNAIFKLMRANELIWNFVVNNYLLGKEPLNFDLLYWSSDGVRMPAQFHTEYLRNCYIENNIVKPNGIQMFGQGIDLKRIQQPSYVVAGIEDHIVPWRSAHKLASFISGPTRLILGNGGHIGSVINPVSTNKGSYFTNDSGVLDSEQWLKTAKRNEGSWWPDWAKWLGAQSGEMVPPPSMGNAEYKPITDAPGTYVVEP